MIKLESIHIEEVRGIRYLDLDFNKTNFAILGPNGSGKSGVIDAIEFGLTGEIKRLTGSGTKGLSVSEHGPHIDMAKFPDASFVELRVFIPELGKSATITRKMKSPKTPTIEPADDDVKAALTEVAEHPEITLSRRDIIRFILVEPTKRSQEIQSLLTLDELGQTRSVLRTASNRLDTIYQAADAQVKSTGNALRLHLQIEKLDKKEVLAAANQRREILDLPAIATFESATELDSDITHKTSTPEFNKESALRDLKALSEAEAGLLDLGKAEAAAIVDDLAKLELDPALLGALQRRSLVEKGLDLVDGPECPLCDVPWEDEQHLREHLEAKLAKSKQARDLQDALVGNGRKLSDESTKIVGLLVPVQKLAVAEEQGAVGRQLSDWKTNLQELKPRLTTIEGLTGLKDRLTDGWPEAPKTLAESIKTLTAKVKARPDQSATVAAQTFLTKAQVRLGDYRDAMRKAKTAKSSRASGKVAYDTYCGVLDSELNALYNEVQDDFSTFYSELNDDDEGSFTAKFTPTEGSLVLDVNFYNRGLFPPGAYHSEGHQDGMGVCLYLALMKRLFGDRFTLALLDDVVMSVDVGHRYQFCKLLKAHFPNTQFIITTHDRLWAEQMKSTGLVTSKTSIAFHSWTIDTGPLVESNEAIWDEIDAALAKGRVDVAAAALRRHLEYVSRHLADHLCASPQFRADGDYQLGELLPAVQKRMKELLGKATKAAQSWGKETEKEVVKQRKESLSASSSASNIEQWAINKAVHYNAWANFGRKDFEPVVAAFKELLGQFRCDSCDSWVYVIPKRGASESLRCACTSIFLNLKTKPK